MTNQSLITQDDPRFATLMAMFSSEDWPKQVSYMGQTARYIKVGDGSVQFALTATETLQRYGVTSMPTTRNNQSPVISDSVLADIPAEGDE